MTLPSLSDAASFTNATTACVRSSCVTPAMGDALGGERSGVERAKTERRGCYRIYPRAGKVERQSREAVGFKYWRNFVPRRMVVPTAVDQDKNCFGC